MTSSSSKTGPLARIFVGALNDARRAEFSTTEDLEATLRATIDGARLTWPDCEVLDVDFVAYLAQRLPEGEPHQALASAQVGDLYLACACTRGEARALAAFERAFFPEVDSTTARMSRRVPLDADEVKQRLRVLLFLGQSSGPGKIHEYSGRGELRSWFRVVVVRTILDMMALRRDVATDDDQLLQIPAASDDPELQYIKDLYRQEFDQAFREAIEQLEPRARNLLRAGVIDGLSIDEIGAIYSVHRATAARWIAAARDQLIDATRRALRKRLQVTDLSLDSILRLIASQVDLSLRGLLQPDRD